MITLDELAQRILDTMSYKDIEQFVYDELREYLNDMDDHEYEAKLKQFFDD
tara:strand:+ start:156 stop:308 length:153 start_codon:yes stop_codon:yes gene_type:complete